MKDALVGRDHRMLQQITPLNRSHHTPGPMQEVYREGVSEQRHRSEAERTEEIENKRDMMSRGTFKG